MKIDYGLRVPAPTTDVKLSGEAWRCICRSAAKLQVVHLIFRPLDAFCRKLFCRPLTQQEARGAMYAVSFAFAPLIEGNALVLRLESRQALVVAGHLPWQSGPERLVYACSRRLIAQNDSTSSVLREAGCTAIMIWSVSGIPRATRQARTSRSTSRRFTPGPMIRTRQCGRSYGSVWSTAVGTPTRSPTTIRSIGCEAIPTRGTLDTTLARLSLPPCSARAWPAASTGNG